MGLDLGPNCLHWFLAEDKFWCIPVSYVNLGWEEQDFRIR